MRRSLLLICALAIIFMAPLVSAVYASESLTNVTVNSDSVTLGSSAGIQQVKYFTLDTPKRLVVDLYGTKPEDPSITYTLKSGFNKLRIGVFEDKSRFVFDVDGDVFPTFRVENTPESVVVEWQSTTISTEDAMTTPLTSSSSKVTAIDFKTEDNFSKFYFNVSGNVSVTKPEKDGDKITFSLKNTTLPKSLRRIYDTFAFPTAIYSVMPYLVNDGGIPTTRFVITLKGDVPWQLQKSSDGFVFVVNNEVYADSNDAITGTLPVPASLNVTTDQTPKYSNNPLLSINQDEQLTKYSGEKTSLVFDDADVRDILRLIAEIKNFNIVFSDNVKGTITLRLIDVPWDQALDLVLEMTGLGMIQEGNVVRIMQKTEMREMRQDDLTAVKTEESLEALTTEVVSVSYAALKSVSTPAKDLLSDRGTITEDARNKLLIITDVSSRIQKIKELIDILDTPERQVMIEARIVQVSSTYSRDLGISWGFLGSENVEDPDSPSWQLAGAGGGDFLVDVSGGELGTVPYGGGFATEIQIGRYLIDDVILDLQLSALESDGKSKTISMPRVTTLNGETAVISQGTTIPYVSYGDGGSKTEFLSAELKLQVTPVINPDNTIILDILTTNDVPSAYAGADAPSIDTKKAQTKLLVRNGETTVIGGIFVETQSDCEDGVPGLKNVPVFGNLFKSQKKSSSKDELLIFITPHIVQVD